LHTLRQASRRSWRIGQKYPVRVKFLTYKNTMQETCLRLMGKKMLVALMMEGKFSGEGLQSLDADEDLLSAMARELVEKAGVGERADEIWRQLDRERNKHIEPVLDQAGSPEAAHEVDRNRQNEVDPQAPSGIHAVPASGYGKSEKTPPWPPTRPAEGPQQLSLFG
jgi:hypothetical protein